MGREKPMGKHHSDRPLKKKKKGEGEWFVGRAPSLNLFSAYRRAVEVGFEHRWPTPFRHQFR